jgi:hypothetical protein
MPMHRALGEFVVHGDQRHGDLPMLDNKKVHQRRTLHLLISRGLIQHSGFMRRDGVKIPMYCPTEAGVKLWQEVSRGAKTPPRSRRSIDDEPVHLAVDTVAQCPVTVFDLVRVPKPWSAGDRVVD